MWLMALSVLQKLLNPAVCNVIELGFVAVGFTVA